MTNDQLWIKSCLDKLGWNLMKKNHCGQLLNYFLNEKGA